MCSRWFFLKNALALGIALALSACGGDQSKGAAQADNVVIDGDEVSVSWDRTTAAQATAVGLITSDEPVLVAAQAIEAVKGCSATTGEAKLGKSIFVRADGLLEITLGIDCTKVASAPQDTRPQPAAQQVSDAERMAAAVEQALRQVAAQPASAAQPAVIPASLYEGSPYSVFSPAQIQAYCQQDWTTRTAANGRTEYNPCTQRPAFR